MTPNQRVADKAENDNSDAAEAELTIGEKVRTLYGEHNSQNEQNKHVVKKLNNHGNLISIFSFLFFYLHVCISHNLINISKVFILYFPNHIYINNQFMTSQCVKIVATILETMP